MRVASERDYVIPYFIESGGQALEVTDGGRVLHVTTYSAETAGYEGADLLFQPGPTSCGPIKDGVALGFTNLEGMFVIAYEDLIQMAELAKAARVPR